jgi:NDP-sugar pyrophosphorylase family protein
MSRSISKAMLMAAGLGTRLRPFTQSRTKALLPLMGVPMAQFAMDSLSLCGVERVVANVHHDAERTQLGLKSLEFGSGEIVISDESELLLGSAGGIRNALSHFGTEPFFLANADVVSDVDWKMLSIRHQYLRRQWGVTLTLTLFEFGAPGASYREIFFDRHTGLITALGDQQVGKPFFVGAAVLEPEAFASLPSGRPADFVEDVLRPAIQKQKVGYFMTKGSWYDIGSPLLWLKTHLSFLSRMETGDFRSKVSRCWAKRVTQGNIRVGDRMWRSLRSPVPKTTTTWNSPCYLGDSYKADIPASWPVHLGPNAVLYGYNSEKNQFQNGIGFSNHWFTCVNEG